MTKKIAWANIYRDMKSKDPKVLLFAMRGGPNGRVLLAPPTELAIEEFELRVGTKLIEALDSYETTTAEDRDWVAAEGIRSFIKKHLCVSVKRLEFGDLDVQPLHHERGGYIGKEGEHIIVPAVDIAAKIASILKDAFAVAT